MFNLGAPEIMVILLVALVVIGPKKLPDAIRQLGKAIREFRQVTNDMRADLTDALGVDEIRDAFDINRLLADDPAPAVAPPTPGAAVPAGGATGPYSAVPAPNLDVPPPDGVIDGPTPLAVPLADVPAPASSNADVLA